MEILKGVESFAGNQSPKSNTAVVVAIDDDVVVEIEDVVDVVLLERLNSIIWWHINVRSVY